MPALISHYIFADDVKDENINNVYYIFASSHDYLDYNLNKKIKKLSHTGHIKNTQNYLINIIEYIKNNNLENNLDVISYLKGSLTHYVLDSKLHPYIFYLSGTTIKNKHQEVERNFDAYLYQSKYKKDFHKSNVLDFIPKIKFSNELNNCINYAYYQTYNINNISSRYKKGIINARIINRIIFKKNKSIKLFDKLFKSKFIYFTRNININLNYLNITKKKWFHPCDKKEIYNKSILDLYNESIKEYKNILKIINKYFHNEITINELKENIPDISYTTGKLIKEKKKMQYFAS